ncbi:5715_t:CDS:2, partial [Cetraspora pellucida]
QSWFNATKFNFKICNETEVVQTIKNNQIKPNDEIELIDFEADSFSCSKFRTTNTDINVLNRNLIQVTDDYRVYRFLYKNFEGIIKKEKDDVKREF